MGGGPWTQMPTIRLHQAPSENHIHKEAGQSVIILDGLPYPRIEPHQGRRADGTSVV